MSQLDFPAIVDSFKTASNDMLAAVLDQSADCIKVIGPLGTLDYMNRNGRCAMGIDDFSAVAGKSWWDLWPTEAQPVIKEAVARAQAGENSRFEAFCPTGKGEPRWWDVSVAPLRDEQGRLQGLISVSRDVTAGVTARELRENTSAEMRHRLQNAYMLTSAIIMASARGTPDREEFAREIVDKLQRLGIAQSLLLDAEKLGNPSLDALVRRLTEPFCGNSCTLEIAHLPDVTLDEKQVRALALALGEFSTNSNKYGALGHGGRIAVRGKIVAGILTLRWSETADVPVEAHERDGSAGFRLIRRTLSSLQGSLDIAWRKDGLEVTVLLPGF